MNRQEKLLYHQVHPIKLLTDWSAGIIALYLLWVQNIVMALIMAFVPPVIVSFAIIQLSDLEKYKQSSPGKYMQKYMTRRMEILRFIGYAIMAIGAWYHIIWLIPLGLILILLAWFRGIIFPIKS